MTSAPPHPAAAAAAAMPPWHLAASLASLKAAVDAHWPGRDKRSDGGIGDARHQAEGPASDHNPWLRNAQGLPTVRAYDFTATQPAAGITGVDGPWLAEQLRLAGAAGDNRLAGKSGDVNDNGYVIWNRHITAPDFSRWVPYDGADPHTTHVHVSVTRDPGGFEDGRPWTFLDTVPLHPAGQPADGIHWTGQDATGVGDGFRAEIGDQGPNIKELQHELNENFPAYSHLAEDGDYGHQTADVIEEFAHREAVDPTTPPPREDVEGLKTADGLNIGPRIARGLHRDGLI